MRDSLTDVNVKLTHRCNGMCSLFIVEIKLHIHCIQAYLMLYMYRQPAEVSFQHFLSTEACEKQRVRDGRWMEVLKKMMHHHTFMLFPISGGHGGVHVCLSSVSSSMLLNVYVDVWMCSIMVV